jgi:hypothetical protein
LLSSTNFTTTLVCSVTVSSLEDSLPSLLHTLFHKTLRPPLLQQYPCLPHSLPLPKLPRLPPHPLIFRPSLMEIIPWPPPTKPTRAIEQLWLWSHLVCHSIALHLIIHLMHVMCVTVGILMIVGLLTCAFYVCLRQRIHRFYRGLPRSARFTPTKRPRNESDSRDLEKATRQTLVTKSLCSPPTIRTSLPSSISLPLSPIEKYTAVQPPWNSSDDQLPGPASVAREDEQGQLIPTVHVSLPCPPCNPRSQSAPRMLSVYGRQVAVLVNNSPPTSPVPTVTAHPSQNAQDERNHSYIDNGRMTSDVCSSPKQECQSLIPTIEFQPHSPSLHSVAPSPVEPASPGLPLWSERLISRSSCASSLHSNVHSSTGSFLVHSKIESMMNLQRTGTPSEDSEATVTLPPVDSETSSGWRFSSSSGVSGTTSEGIRSSQETTYPALSALMALVAGCEAETQTYTEHVHQIPRSPSPVGAEGPSTSVIPPVASDEFVEISLSSEPPMSNDAEHVSPPDVDSVPTGGSPTKKSGRQRTPESRLISQLIDELTGGSGRWKSYDEFFGISQDDLVDLDEPTPSSTPDSGTPLSTNFSLPGTPTNVTFLPPRVPSRPIGRQPTFIGMDWDIRRTSTHINMPQRMPAAKTRSSHPLSLILEVDSSESASLYSQDRPLDSADVSRSSSISEITIRDRTSTHLGNDGDLQPPSQSDLFSIAPSRTLIRPLVLSEKYPKPRPLTLDITTGALPQSQSCLESNIPSLGLCSLADTDLETRKRMGMKPPPPRPILPKDLEAVYPSAQDKMEDGPDGATLGFSAMIGRLIGLGTERMADSKNSTG